MVNLLLSKKKWKVELNWEGDQCVFGKGWSKFARKCKLEEADTVVVYRCPTEGVMTLNIVISKREDEIEQPSRGIYILSTEKITKLHTLTALVNKTYQNKS